MNGEITLWIFGAAITVLGLVLGAVWNSVREVSKGLADFRAEVPKIYVSENDVKRVETAIADMRAELRQDVKELATAVQQQVNNLISVYTSHQR